MIERTLAKRYAAAMLAVAEREGIVEEVESNLLALKSAYESDAVFRATLAQPKMPRAVRRRVLRRPFEGRVHETFLAFLDVLVDKNRISLLPEIADTFDRLADATKGVVRVQVLSAYPLSQAQEAALSERLAGITGKKIHLMPETDRSLKGGLQIRIGDSVVDGTVVYRLKSLREKIFEMQRR